MNERLEALLHQANPPFVYAEAYDGDFMVARTKDAFTIAAIAKEGEIDSTMTALVREMERARQFGFTVSEYERAKINILKQYESAFNERDKQKNSSYTKEYMMLYHVPDINRALCEVKRVLKKNGTFYCATYGEHGIVEYLSGILGMYGIEDKTNKRFTLQNGGNYLNPLFEVVERQEYKDSLVVTDVNDLVDYLYSLTAMSTLDPHYREAIRETLQNNMEAGVLNVPKEYGLFVCRQ